MFGLDMKWRVELDPNEIRKRMAELKWFHHIDLGHGIITPGAGGPNWNELLERSADIYYGMGIEGQTVLDVGAFDGFNSFAAERRGASHVVAADWWVWRHDFPGESRMASFDFAHKVLKSKVEKRIIDIPDMNVATMGQFDHVGFNGIVYHISNPFSALENMAAITRRVISIETHIDCQDVPHAVALYYGAVKRKPPLTPQTGWGFNSLCMHAYLKSFGFETVMEFPTPTDPEKRSIFIGIKPGYFKEYIEANQQYAKPRFDGT
jgi:tRNA (mo5U34)-methyltransferase